MNETPESWISHTLVTGGRVDFWAPTGFVGAGVDGDEELGVEEVGAGEVFGGVVVLAGVLAGAAGVVAWGVTGGGWAACALACALAAACDLAASEAINGGSRALAREAWGAGPIAAPTTTPTASIVAASAAAARVEGRRTTLACVSTTGDAAAPGEVALGVGVSGVSIIVWCGFRPSRDSKVLVGSLS